MQVVEVLEPGLVERELMDEGGPDFQVGPPTVQELETLEQRPFVFAHDVASESARRTTLAPH